jgi:hypothetical protein
MSELIEAVETTPGRWTPQVLGLHPKQTNAEYQSAQAESKSRLDAIARPNCPLHYWDKYENPDPPPERRTPALILGDAIHKAVLEPDIFDRFIVRLPEDAPARPNSRTLKAKKPSLQSQDAISYWADFDEENRDKLLVSDEDYRTVVACRDAVHMHPVAKHLFRGGLAEQSYYAIDPETGALIKCRADYEQLEREASITDLKTTEDASERGFKSSIYGYRYDIQDAWYRHVLRSAYQGQVEVRRFVFVGIEKVRPYCVGVYTIAPEDTIAGMIAARRDLSEILECRRTGEWPDYGCNPKVLRINRTV